MVDYRYLIAGGGMAAHAAVQGIREIDLEGSIGLIGAEANPPYKRPPLSKGLWKGKKLETIWLPSEKAGAELHMGRTIRSLDLGSKQVADDQGGVYGFDKLLIATGGTPRRLPFGRDVIYFRTVDDYSRLRSLTGQGRHFAVIGGGFIGSEVAAALAMNGEKVTMVFPEEAIGARVYPRDLALYLNDHYGEHGVEVLAKRSVVGIEPRGDRQAVISVNADGSEPREILADAIVAGLGILPNVELAQAAGLPAGNGIDVDEFMRAGHPDVYAAGDVAAFYNPALAKRLRVEHEDNANTMGRLAGRGMAGEQAIYHHLPSFYSDLFDLGYEAVGELDSRLETAVDWHDPYHEGVIYYRQGGVVRGVLLWNVWNQVDAARQLIAEGIPLSADELQGRLPEAA